jgi:hypothetical protein
LCQTRCRSRYRWATSRPTLPGWLAPEWYRLAERHKRWAARAPKRE